MKKLLMLIVSLTLVTPVLAADPPGLSDEQLKKMIADSAEYKKKALAYMTAELARARSAPLSGANRVEAAKSKGERIAGIEKRIKELKANANYIRVTPFLWRDMKPGAIGVLHSDGTFRTTFEVRRVIDDSQAIIEVTTSVLNPQGGPPDSKSERFLVSGIATAGLRDGIEFTDERVFQVVGTTKVQGSSMIEMKPFDIEARVAAMKKK